MNKLLVVFLLVPSLLYQSDARPQDSQKTVTDSQKTVTDSQKPIAETPPITESPTNLKPSIEQGENVTTKKNITLSPPKMLPSVPTQASAISSTNATVVISSNDKASSKPTSVSPTAPITVITTTLLNAPKLTTPKPSAITTVPPATTEKVNIDPKTASTRAFDGASFVGGIVLTLGLIAMGFLGLKYYNNRGESNYSTF